jgi:hypothetical protein
MAFVVKTRELGEEPIRLLHVPLAAGARCTVRDLSRWLASGQFPNPKSSQQILGALLRDQIGTDDQKLIETDIAPPLRPALVIRIRWKDDGPGGMVHVQKRITNQIRPQVHPQQ